MFEPLNSGLIGRSPYGERGLKYVVNHHHPPVWQGRSPYGERGLKWYGHGNGRNDGGSLSLRRAWIEIVRHRV